MPAFPAVAGYVFILLGERKRPAVFCGVLLAGVIVSLVVALPSAFGFLTNLFTGSVPNA